MAIIWFWIILVLIGVALLQSYLAAKKVDTYRAENILFPLYPTFSRSFEQKNIYNERVRVSEILFSIANYLLRNNINSIVSL